MLCYAFTGKYCKLYLNSNINHIIVMILEIWSDCNFFPCRLDYLHRREQTIKLSQEDRTLIWITLENWYSKLCVPYQKRFDAKLFTKNNFVNNLLFTNLCTYLFLQVIFWCVSQYGIPVWLDNFGIENHVRSIILATPLCDKMI